MPACLYFQAHALPLLIGCFIAGLALWLPVKNGWTDKIFLRRRPLTLSEPGGIALYSKRRREIIFHGFFKEPRQLLEKISLFDLFFRYSALPLIVVKKGITAEIFQKKDGPAYKLSVENLRFILITGSDPLKFFAAYKSKSAVLKFLTAAVDEALQTAGEQLKILEKEATIFDWLDKVFLIKLNELLVGRYYQVDSDFKFLTVIQKIIKQRSLS
jgi:hypothetical protein